MPLQACPTIKYAMQTQYPDFEVIAINDGSKDKTAEILDELPKPNLPEDFNWKEEYYKDKMKKYGY